MAASLEKCDTPMRAALAPLLPADVAVPVRIRRFREGIAAVHNPAAETRESVWRLLTELFGQLRDVTPEVTR